MLVEDLEHLVGYVRGVNPVTKHESHSPLYSKINSRNVAEIFQTPLGHKYGKEVKGAKAIVYKAYDGSYLAVAESLGAELWTADNRLVESLDDDSLEWIHWIGE